MSSIKSLWELQQTETELESKRAELERIRSELKESDALLAARARLAESKERLAAIERQQKDIDAEVDGLREKLKRVNEKLFDGKTKNPKELVSFQQEAKSLGVTMRGKEDILLDLMGETEKYKARMTEDIKGLAEVEAGWNKDQEGLKAREADLVTNIDTLIKKRATAVAAITPETLELYRSARPGQGVAVARVDQGRCQGCRISLSMAELQRVRVGTVVKCSNCGRILYLE
jgi:predicted  nucleic acid-binding Zn-ribbon protein